MVLRPTVLRYKGKARKIDSSKLKKAQQREKENLKEVEKMQILPKSQLGLAIAASIVFVAPIIYMGYNNFASQKLMLQQ